MLILTRRVKKDIYQKALNLLGEEIYTENVCWSEDRIVNFALFRVAESFKYINIFGIIHIRISSSIGNNWLENKKDKIFNDELINIKSKYKILFNNTNINIAFFELKSLWKLYSNDLNLENINNIKIKLLNLKYISKEEKNKIIRLFGNKIKY